jgi:hypothetical protein
MGNFDPAGAKARWKTIYELLKLTNDNGILTYREMGEALGLDPETDRGAIVQAVRRAAKEHEEVDKRAITAVPNKGYRIAAPKEHLDLARRQQKRSSKALVRGQSKVVNVNMSKLDPEARRAFEVVAQGFAQLMDFNRRFERRQQEHTEVIASLVETTQRSDAERDELKERLARVEEKLQLQAE